MSRATLIERFDLAGFRPGAPDGETLAIDRAVCRESRCCDCGAVGPAFRAFIHRKTGEYRCFAICRRCGNVEEF
jgi:hypothetical protein